MSQIASDLIVAVAAAGIIGAAGIAYRTVMLINEISIRQDTHSNITSELIQGFKEHDKRLDDHDIEIAVLKERHETK